MSSSNDIKCKVIEEELRSVWPDWHVAGRLGGGAFGDVFQIYRDNHGIRVDSALKVIQVDSEENSAALLSNGQDDGKTESESQSDIPEALLSEIQIMEALRGAPNIVAIEDFYFKKEGSTNTLFVRMELLTSLEKVLPGRDGHGTLSSIREIIKLGRDVCRALVYCEKKDIIHRDIKPANLFRDEFGDYKVGDFGASKRMDTIHVARTMTGIGTVSYMAPEIFQGRSYNNTVDIYALGLVLYQFLNKGRIPFLPEEGSYTTQDIDSANFHRLHGTPVPSLAGKSFGEEVIDSRLDAVVRKACAMDPADRYQTAEEFYDALEFPEIEEKQPIPVYAKRPQGSLAPDASLQKRQQERTWSDWSDRGKKPSGDLEPAVSLQDVPQGRKKSGSEEKTLTTPLTDKSSQSRLQKAEKRSGRNNIPVIIIVILLIIAVAALAASLSGRGSSSSTDSDVAVKTEEQKGNGFEEDGRVDESDPDAEPTDAASEEENRDPGPISDSWEEIVTAGEKGTYINKYKIGDTKELDLGEEGVIEMELVAFDEDELADGSGKAPMTWIAKNLLNTEHVMNEERTNAGGWPASDMREWLRESILPMFPETVRLNICEVKKYTTNSGTGGMISSLDTIWIPSRREMFGSHRAYEHERPEQVGDFWEYQIEGKQHTGISELSGWWLRSVSTSDSGVFDSVNIYREFSTLFDANVDRGVVIGFCLGASGSFLNTSSEEDNRAPGPISDSWEEIITAGEDGTYIDKYKIGDTKELDLGEEGVIEMELVAFDADELADSSGKAPMTWIAKTLLNTEYEIRIDNGFWPTSDVRKWLHESILPLFPEKVRSNIKEVKKYSYSYSNNETNSSSDTIWIPSRREMYGADCAYEDEGPEYITLFPDDASRQKQHTGVSKPSSWWLRSASFGDDRSRFYGFDYVNCGGASDGSDYYVDYGVAIGFCF